MVFYMIYSKEYYKNLFLQKFEEIERCYTNPTNFSIINVTPALRILLFDTTPLIDIVNRENKIPITFCVNNSKHFDDTEKAISILLWKEINVNINDEYISLKKDAFLKWQCIHYLGKAITILDVIKFYAYVRGGIHLDNCKKEFQPLREAFELIKFGHLSSFDHTMRGIIQVIYKTLSENKERLLMG